MISVCLLMLTPKSAKAIIASIFNNLKNKGLRNSSILLPKMFHPEHFFKRKQLQLLTNWSFKVSVEGCHLKF